MAPPALSRGALPGEPHLRSFARAAAHLLIERQSRMVGARIVRRTAGVGVQHLDHRDYVSGDEVRHIDWRQTARRRRPIVRRFESESISDWTILLDASSSMVVPGTSKWPRARDAAAAMAYALLEMGQRVGLVAFGARVLAQCRRGRGQRDYAKIAQLLSTLRPPARGERSDLGACLPYVHGAASVLVVSDFLAESEMRTDLTALLQRCTALHALQVSDRAETQLEADGGERELVDIETGQRLQVTVDEHARALAQAERAAMTARLRAFCARSGIAFSDWPADETWQHVLLRHLVAARAMC
jgi:uncharacterized protein (DUF58 family)